MPDLLLTKAPHWEWLAVGYFFLGGLAGGCAFIGALASLFGTREAHGRVIRLSRLVAFPAIVLGSSLLIIDLRRPDRFWHMLLMSERPGIVFKAWSPISVGAWAVAAFGAIAALQFLVAIRGDRGGLLGRLDAGIPGRVLAILCGGLGFFIAAYTGVLLSVTNRPLWAETPLLGLVFLLSAASTSAALLEVVLVRSGDGDGPATRWLARFAAAILLPELLALGALVFSLGSSASLVGVGWTLAFGVGVIGLGIVLPLALRRAPRFAAISSLLIVGGGLLLRAVIVMSVEAL